jgi:hypothetical protein
MQISALCGQKSKIADQQDLAVAYDLVPWLEGLSKGFSQRTSKSMD